MADATDQSADPSQETRASDAAATPTVPASTGPVRVAECGACRQLFVVPPEIGPSLACPVCGVARRTSAVAIKELGVAVTIEPESPDGASSEDDSLNPLLPPEETSSASADPSAPLEPTPTLASMQPEPAAESASAGEPPRDAADEPADSAPPLPSVADWLKRADTDRAATAGLGDSDVARRDVARAELPQSGAEPTAGTPAGERAPEDTDSKPAKPSLSDALGWSPGSFRLDAVGGVDAVRSAQPAEPASPGTEPPVAPKKSAHAESLPSEGPSPSDFGFDFSRTPLAEPRVDDAAPRYGDSDGPDSASPAAATPADAATLDDDRWQETLLAHTADREKKSPTWLGRLGQLAAALLLIAAPAAYFLGDSLVGVSEVPSNVFAESSPAESNRARRADLLEPQAFDGEASRELGADDDVVVAAPVEPTPSPSEVASDRRYDGATEPASFVADPSESSRYGGASERPAPVDQPAFTDRYAATTVEPPTPTVGESGDRNAALPSGSGAVDPFAAAPSGVAESAEARFVLPPASRAELSVAIDQARGAGQAFAAGDLSDPDQVVTLGNHYARLCHLAQALTAYQDDGTDRDAVVPIELEAIDAFRRALDTADSRGDSASIAGPWIDWVDRPHNGVFFAGVPVDSVTVGPYVAYRFELGGQPVSVLTDEPIDARRYLAARSEEMGIIGVLIEQPSETLPGYDGDADRVVWARKTLALTAPRTP